MKKNETKNGNTRNQELTKQQAEDRVFNRMLLWLAGAVVVELIMLLFNRVYVHARVSELGVVPVWRTVLLILLVVGIILFAAFLAGGIQLRKGDGQSGTLQFILAAGCLCVGVGGYAMRQYTSSVAPVVLAVVPGLAVLAMVFYLYQKEFFACALVGGMGILGLWIFRITFGSHNYVLYLVVALVITALLTLLAWKLQKQEGIWKWKERELTLLPKDTAYPAYYLTAVLTVVLLLIPMALGAAVAYYSIWVLAAWLLILAVFFTSRMM